jgi:hypothetical protein
MAAGDVERIPEGPDGPCDSAEPTEEKRVQRGAHFPAPTNIVRATWSAHAGREKVNSAANPIGFSCVRATSTTEKTVKQQFFFEPLVGLRRLLP